MPTQPGEAVWKSLTFVHGGAPVDTIVTASEAPTAIVVSGNRTDVSSGNTRIPRWTWTDWTPITSLTRTDLPGARGRHDPSAATIWMQAHASKWWITRVYADASINKGFEYVAGHLPRDAVTAPLPINARAAGFGSSKSPVSCVQFLTRNSEIVGMTTGDSHHQGTGTTTQFWNYLLRTTVEIGARHMVAFRSATGPLHREASNSEWFFASLVNVLSLANPSFVVLPGWTYNDKTEGLHADQLQTTFFLLD